jgi:lipopolysaccharide heptosyltransferase II
MGDVLMTGPAIRALAGGRGGARSVTLLTSPAGAEAAALMPGIDEVVVYEAPWMKATARLADGRAARAMAAWLRRRRYDGAVIFTVYSQSPFPAATLCHLADIPLVLAHCRENPYQLLTGWAVEREPADLVRHEVRRQLDLVASVGFRVRDERLAVEVPAGARERVTALLDEVGPGGPLVVVHPGASAPSRRYPAERFAAVAGRLASRAGCRVVFTGSEEEAGLAASIRAATEAPSWSLAGRLSLPELAALLSEARLLVAGNTGPVHLAAAVGTPVVDLYALTNPQHAPWMVPARVLSHDVACKWCYKSVCPEGHHLCLRGVPAEDVYGAACELLGSLVQNSTSRPDLKQASPGAAAGPPPPC